ncbi:S1C family serine protease [Planctomycetota bacterium]
MRNNKNLLTVLIVFIILVVVVVVLFWDRQQRRVFDASQSRLQANLAEDWGPGSQQQIQSALGLKPAAFSTQVSYKNIIARVAPSVVSINTDTGGLFNNAAQVQPVAQTLGLGLTASGQDMQFQNIQPQRVAATACPYCNGILDAQGRCNQTRCPIYSPDWGSQGSQIRNVAGMRCPNCINGILDAQGRCNVQGCPNYSPDWSLNNSRPGRMGGYAMGPIGNLVCPSCGTTVPHQRGVPAYTVNCPNCQKPMMREGSPGICRIPTQTQPVAAQNTPVRQTPNVSPPVAAQSKYWVCPNCRTSVPCPRNTVGSANCPGCPSCGIQMNQSQSPWNAPGQPQTQQPQNQQPVDNYSGFGGSAQYVWGGRMNAGGYWNCPRCCITMPCRQGLAGSLNCPGCPGCGMQMQIMRGGSAGNYQPLFQPPTGSQQGMQQQQQQQIIPKFQARGKGGSGVIVNRLGYVLTNHHVIHGAKKIAVTVYTGQTSKTYQADLIDEAPELDFAILKIAGNGKVFTPAPMGSSSGVSVGDEVLAIGSPFGLQQTTTFGIVSNTRRTMTVGNQKFTDFIQTDAPTNPGSSGGVLVNINGEVIGINTAIYSPTQAFSGIGFARPIDSATAAFPDFIETGAGQAAAVAFQRGSGLNPWCPPGGSRRQASAVAFQRGSGQNPWCPPGGPMRQVALPCPPPGVACPVGNAQGGQCWMGIRTCPVDEQMKASLGLPMARGVVVTEVFAGSPCIGAGLQNGDVIVRVDNRSLKDEAMLADLLGAKGIGDKMKLSVYRDGKKANIKFSLGPRPGGIQGQPAGLMESLTLPGTPETQVLPGF